MFISLCITLVFNFCECLKRAYLCITLNNKPNTMNLFKVLLQERSGVHSIIVKALNENEAFYKLTPKQRTQVLGITKL